MAVKEVKVTERGKLVAARMREERQENIERNNGVYVPDPWYKRYLSPNFVIPQQTIASESSYMEDDNDETLLDTILEDEEGDEETEEDEDY